MVEIASQEIHRHAKGKKMEKDGCKEFFRTLSNWRKTTAGQILPPHACKLLQDWGNEECKRLSAKYDVYLPDLAALGAPQR